MSSRETLPYDPRRDPRTPHGFIARLGQRAINRGRGARRMWTTLSLAVASTRTPGTAAAAEVRRIAMSQIVFTGVQAVGLVSAIALLLGATIIIQTNLMAPGTPGEMLGKILVAVVLRELAPLVTAIIVAGRSGTAIATELGNMKASSEVLALSSLGIDPPRFIVLPRLIGAAASVLVLTVYFSVVAVAGGYTVSLLITAPSFTALRSGFGEALVPADLALFLVKGTGLGLIVGFLSCHFGLEVKSSPTEVPQKASAAVVMILFGCVAFNLVVTAMFYWIVGPPIR